MTNASIKFRSESSSIPVFYMGMQAVKELESLHVYTGLLEPSFLDTAMSTSIKIKCAGSFDLFFVFLVIVYLTGLVRH